MAHSSEFLEFVLESLQPLRGVSARRMFGGWGIYKDGVMFALIAYDQLYFKVDAGNRAAYEDAGLPHFTYADKGKPIRMPYREAPPEGFDDPKILCAWARDAYAAALRAKANGRKYLAAFTAAGQAFRAAPGLRGVRTDPLSRDRSAAAGTRRTRR